MSILRKFFTSRDELKNKKKNHIKKPKRLTVCQKLIVAIFKNKACYQW